MSSLAAPIDVETAAFYIPGARRLGDGNSLELPLGVTGNTPDSGSGESRFETWRGNAELYRNANRHGV